MTYTHYSANTPLVFAFYYFWLPNCNAFIFLYDLIIVILLDIIVLTSLLVTGIEMNANLSIDGLPDYDFLSMSTSCTFNQFQTATSASTIDKPSFHKHVSFLLILICKYMLYILGQQIARKFKPLARAIVASRKLALT